MDEAMTPPKTTLAKILKALIEGKKVDLRTFTGSSLRNRISDIRNDYGFTVESYPVHGTNEFGNRYTFSSYVIRSKDLKFAKEVYLKINKPC